MSLYNPDDDPASYSKNPASYSKLLDWCDHIAATHYEINDRDGDRTGDCNCGKYIGNGLEDHIADLCAQWANVPQHAPVVFTPPPPQVWVLSMWDATAQHYQVCGTYLTPRAAAAAVGITLLPSTDPHPNWFRFHNPDHPDDEYTLTRHNVDT